MPFLCPQKPKNLSPQRTQRKPKSLESLSPVTCPLQPLPALFPDQAQLAVFSIESEAPQLGRLRRKLREHRAARPLKRRRIGKYRDAQRQRSERPQRVQSVAERHSSVAIAHVLVEVQVRQRRYNQRVGGEFFDETRQAHQQFGQLKTSERPRHANPPVEFRRRNSSLPRQARNQQRVKPVRAVQAQHLFSFGQQARQKI